MKYLFTFFLSVSFSALLAQSPGAHNMLDFNGSSTYVECGAVDFTGSSLTMSTWVRVDAFKTGFPYITSLIGTEVGSEAAMIRVGDASIPNNIVQFILSIAGTQQKLEATTALVANRWYHIAGTYDGADMKIYINGVLDASLSVTGSVTSNEAFTIGRNYGNDRVLDGKLDEARVWSIALSEATIRDWMCKKVTSSHPNYANLQGYWRMDEGTGTTVADLSTSGNNGTFTGSPQWTTSAAPVGDESAHSYAAPFSANLAHPSGGQFGALTSSSSAELLHVYRVDESPNDIVYPAGVDTAQSGHYWGVFSAGTSGNIPIQMDYSYSTATLFNPNYDCNATLLIRDDATDTPWEQSATAANDGTGQALTDFGITRQEVWIARADTFDLQLSGPLDFCNGDSVVLSTQLGGSFTVTSQTWLNGGVPITGANDTSLTVMDSGTYSSSVVTSSGCNANFRAVQVTTDPGPVTAPTIGPFCEADAPVTLSGGTPSAGFYKVNGVFSGQFNPGLVGPGTHTIRYVAFGNSFGCIDSAETQVLVNASPNATMELDTSICEGDLLALPVGLPTGGTYSGTGVSGTDFDAATSGAGFFEVYYTVTSAEGCEGADTGFVTVNLLPNPPIINPSNGSLVSNKINGNQWYLNGDPVDGATNALFTPTVDGDYQLTYTDDNGCTSELTDVFAFVGTAEISGGQFRLYPNPANGELDIRSDRLITSVEIIDLQGRSVLSQTNQSMSLKLNIAELATGAYQVRVVANGEVHSKRLLIQR